MSEHFQDVVSVEREEETLQTGITAGGINQDQSVAQGPAQVLPWYLDVNLLDRNGHF